MNPSSADPSGWASVEHRFPPDHPTAAGHFPGNPIIPGALLLDHVLSAIAAAGSYRLPIEVRLAKFLRPVRPGDHVTIRWQVVGSGEVKFECLLSPNGEKAMVGALKRPAA